VLAAIDGNRYGRHLFALRHLKVRMCSKLEPSPAAVGRLLAVFALNMAAIVFRLLGYGSRPAALFDDETKHGIGLNDAEPNSLGVCSMSKSDRLLHGSVMTRCAISDQRASQQNLAFQSRRGASSVQSGWIAHEIDPLLDRHEVDDRPMLRCEQLDASSAVLVRFSKRVWCALGGEQDACLGKRNPSPLRRR
jgi:hypothetical protein